MRVQVSVTETISVCGSIRRRPITQSCGAGNTCRLVLFFALQYYFERADGFGPPDFSSRSTSWYRCGPCSRGLLNTAKHICQWRTLSSFVATVPQSSTCEMTSFAMPLFRKTTQRWDATSEVDTDWRLSVYSLQGASHLKQGLLSRCPQYWPRLSSPVIESLPLSRLALYSPQGNFWHLSFARASKLRSAGQQKVKATWTCSRLIRPEGTKQLEPSHQICFKKERVTTP